MLEHQATKYARRQQWCNCLMAGCRAVQCRLCAIGVLAAILFFVLSAQAQDRIIPPVGGSGGGQFVAHCPPGQLLGGFELRAGDDVDAIRPLCRTPAVYVNKVHVKGYRDGNGKYVPEHDEERVTYGVNGDATATTGWYGGTGGGVKFLVCPSDNPIVSALYVEAEGVDTVIVNRITLLCEYLDGSRLPTAFRNDDRWFSPRYSYDYVKTFEAPKNRENEIRGTSICPVSRDNLATFAVGINGRSGKWLDAVGLICDEAKLPPKPVSVLGRTKAPPPPPGATPAPPRSICEVAREARARNSPAAPALEERCRAAGEPSPVKTLGRVKAPPPDTTPNATPGPPRSICDRAQEARARNSPAAPALEAQCRVTQLNDLATKGEAIANQDPLTVEPRKQQLTDHMRRGFDIGMAAAEGQTAPGPGKQRIRDSLGPEEKYEEQYGFDTAVSFSLERNRNADLASIGAAIAEADPVVAEARATGTDVFYRLGFDIATGIFGDPALGAQGNTATGPGSLKIQDSLSAAGQRGFDASLKLHLSRNYKP